MHKFLGQPILAKHLRKPKSEQEPPVIHYWPRNSTTTIFKWVVPVRTTEKETPRKEETIQYFYVPLKNIVTLSFKAERGPKDRAQWLLPH